MAIRDNLFRTESGYYNNGTSGGQVIFDMPVIEDNVESIYYEEAIRMRMYYGGDDSYSVSRSIGCDYWDGSKWVEIYKSKIEYLTSSSDDSRITIDIAPDGVTQATFPDWMKSLGGKRVRFYSNSSNGSYLKDNGFHGGWYIPRQITYKTPICNNPTVSINYSAQVVYVTPNTQYGTSQSVVVNGYTYNTTNNNTVTIPFSSFAYGTNIISTVVSNPENSSSNSYSFNFPNPYPVFNELYVNNPTNTVDDTTTVTFSASNYDNYHVYVNDNHVVTNVATIPKSAFVVGTNKIKIAFLKFNDGVQFATWSNTITKVYSKKSPTITSFAFVQSKLWIEETMSFIYSGNTYDSAYYTVNNSSPVDCNFSPVNLRKSLFVMGENTVTLTLVKNPIDGVANSGATTSMELLAKVFKREAKIYNVVISNPDEKPTSPTTLTWDSEYQDSFSIYANDVFIGSGGVQKTFTISANRLNIGLNKIKIVCRKSAVSGVADSGSEAIFEDVISLSGDKPVVTMFEYSGVDLDNGTSMDNGITFYMFCKGHTKVKVFDENNFEVYSRSHSDESRISFTLGVSQLSRYGEGTCRFTAYAYKEENGLTMRSLPYTVILNLVKYKAIISNFRINKTRKPITINFNAYNCDWVQLLVNGVEYVEDGDDEPYSGMSIPKELLNQKVNTLTLKGYYTYDGSERRDVESTRLYLVKQNNINFDYYGNYKKPNLVLCNPSLKPIAYMPQAYEVKPTLRFNAISEIEFTIPRRTDLDEETPYFDKVVANRTVLLDGIGYFILQKPVVENDGMTELKTVTGYSLEYGLTQRGINLFSGYYKFYDSVDMSGTLLGEVMAMSAMKGWKLGKVSQSLWGKYREYTITDETIYGFLTQTVANMVECVFDFDYLNKTINVLDVADATTETDISVSFNNLAKNIEVEELSEQFATAMTCIGGGELTISGVNPIGGTMMYNFDYWLDDSNNDDMTQGLKTAIISWKQAIEDGAENIKQLKIDYRMYNEDLINLKAKLVDTKAQYTAVESVLKAQAEAGYDTEGTYLQLEEIQNDINDLEYLIASSNVLIQNIQRSIQLATGELAQSNFFTEEQLVELNDYIKETTYTNDGFTKTSTMTSVEIQEAEQEFYDHCESVLSRMAKPRYSFTLDMVNILFLEEFAHFGNQLRCGCQIQVDMDNGTFSYPILLEMQYNYDDPTDFELTFSNGLRLSKADDKFSDLYSNTTTTSSKVSSGEAIYKDFANNYQNSVSDFINNELNCTAKEIINSDKQEIKITENWLIGRKLKDNGEYDGKQVALINNKLVFTKDGFKTVSAALGETSTGAFGLCAEVVYGNLLCGNELLIATEDGSLTVDRNGTRLHNASFTLTTDSNDNKIIMNAADGIRIQKNEGGDFVDQFYVDANTGDINFKGNLTGASGTFSGSLNVANGVFSVDSTGRCVAKSFYAEGGEMSGVNAYFGNRGNGDYTEIDSYGEINFYRNNKQCLMINSYATQGGSLDIFDNNGGSSIRLQNISSTECNIVTYKPCIWKALKSGIVIEGDFAVLGSKNAVVKTKNYGMRALYATEADKSYFTTNGNNETIKCECRIELDKMFMETIELNEICPYIVQITPYSNAKVWVEEIHDDYVIVKSDKDTAFSYEVMATRIGYKDKYMEENKNIKG